MNPHKALLLTAALCAVASASAQPFWSQYGGNAQHTAEVTTGVQDMNELLWETPVDLFPPVSGTDLFIHYGSPLVTNAGTVVLPVRTGPNANFPSSNDTFQVEGHDLGTGTLLWTATTDFVDWMPHDWIPSYSCAIAPDGSLYYAGAGGTIYKRSSADGASATVTQLCFYGMSNYTSTESTAGDPTTAAANTDIQIDTPITVDSNGNIYFGFYVGSTFTGSPASSGLAEITAAGTGLYVTANQATGDSAVTQEFAMNSAPAISNDGNYVYAAAKQVLWYNYTYPKLVRLNTSDLSTASETDLTQAGVQVGLPAGSETGITFGWILDDGTASPMVGPDGDVYFGTWYTDLESRGFMLHYSSDLSTEKPAGAFGWDDTASVVPVSCVTSYTGSSSYLILTKYNNYSDPGVYGDGLNKVAILDPNATESYTVQYYPNNPGNLGNAGNNWTGPTYTVMNEVESIVGPTANTGQPGVREWCINMAAIDVMGKTAVINSEDGTAYHWDLTTNTLTQSVHLAPATGEAYTPTVVGPDGISFAVNDAELCAMWDGAAPSTVGAANLAPGATVTDTLTLSRNATGPGATIQLSSNNPNIQVPSSVQVAAGSNSVTFNVTASSVSQSQSATISASRYGFTSSATVNVLEPLSHFYASPSGVLGGISTHGVVQLGGQANASGGDVISLQSSSADAAVPATATVPANGTGVSFVVTTSAVSAPEAVTLTATSGTSSLQTTLNLNPAAISNFYFSPATVQGGQSTYGVVQLASPAGPGGDTVSIAGVSYVFTPSTATVPAGSKGVSFLVPTFAISAPTQGTVTVTLGASTYSATITLTPPPISSFFVSPGTVQGGTSTHGVVQIGAKTGINADTVDLYSPSPDVTVPTSVSIPSGGSTGVSFPITTAGVSTSETLTLTATFASSQKTTTITLNPAPVSNFYLSPTSVTGGLGTHGVVQLSGKAGPSGNVISLQSGSADATVPSSVTVPAGSTGVSFLITSSAVSAPENITITATEGSSTAQATLTLNTATISNFYTSPTSVADGASAHGVVQLASKAGPSGDVVTLQSSDPSEVSVPATVTVPAGATGVSFLITTTNSLGTNSVTLTATLGSSVQYCAVTGT